MTKYPWAELNGDYRITSGERVEARPFTITWTVPSAERLHYGWRTETRSFATEAEMLEIAKQSMGVAFSVVAYRWDFSLSHGDKNRRITVYERENPNYGKRRSG